MCEQNGAISVHVEQGPSLVEVLDPEGQTVLVWNDGQAPLLPAVAPAQGGEEDEGRAPRD